MKSHESIDRRSLAMARRIAEIIDADPDRRGLAHAREVCARWVSRGNVPAREWMQILERPWPEIRRISQAILGALAPARRVIPSEVEGSPS